MLTTRRKFIKNSGAAMASAAVLSQIPLGMLAGCSSVDKFSFGFQTWTIREKLTSDFVPTLEMMSAMGYSEVEMCSPLGYTGTGFEKLNDMSGTEMKNIIGDAGLVCSSSHFNMGELRDHLDNRIEWANQLGMKQMVCSSFWLPEESGLDDWKNAIEELNEIGEKVKAGGLQMAFHNHHGEFQKIDDQLIYEFLMEGFDPDLVKMQFQVAVVNIGYEAADFFRAYPGRFISAHLADYSPEKEKQVPIGQGMVDWDDFFVAAETGGVKNFYVEMDPATFEASAEFLKSRS